MNELFYFEKPSESQNNELLEQFIKNQSELNEDIKQTFETIKN